MAHAAGVVQCAFAQVGEHGALDFAGQRVAAAWLARGPREGLPVGVRSSEGLGLSMP